MEDPPSLLKFQNRNVQTFGFVYHDTNGQNHGPVWKTQSFLLSEICTAILWQDLWERQFEKILLEHGWEKIPNWECYSFNEKDYSCPCMWTISNWLERNKTLRASCRRRTGEASISRADKFGDLIAADHEVLNQEGESRNNHGYALVVQDLATQRMKKKLLRRRKKVHESFSNRQKSQKLLTLTIQ